MKASLVRRARAFAGRRHAGQIRKGDGRPFITHPTAVARILQRHGMPAEVVAAGLLHDVLEDTPTTAAELERRFGAEVARMVEEVTEAAKSVPWEERKAAYLAHLPRASRGALAISCADKTHNTESFLEAYDKEGPAVFSRFSRGIEKRLDYHRGVLLGVRRAWARCPVLPELERAVRRMEALMKRRSHSGETEAKLVVRDPAAWKKIQKIRALGPFRRVSGGRELQVNTYWDTRDLRLRAGRAALKLREAKGRAELTFKAEKSYRGGVSERLEISRILDGQALRRFKEGRLEMEPVRRARALVRGKPLAPVLVLLTDRRRIVLGSSRGRIELDLDRVRVRGAKRAAGDHREVELENLDAPPAMYRAALKALRGRFGKGLQPSRAPKYEIGLKMLRGEVELKPRARARAG